MGPTPLYRFMLGEDMPVPKNANALGAALWNAVHNGRIKKTPEGLYALLEWPTEQPELQEDAPPPNSSASSIERSSSEQGSATPGGPPRGKGQGTPPKMDLIAADHRDP
jgi:hypothetical protein